MFVQVTVAQLMEHWSCFMEELGSNHQLAKKFSIYLNEELNQMENKNNKNKNNKNKNNKNKNNNNKNSSNSLVFGRWPQTRIL